MHSEIFGKSDENIEQVDLIPFRDGIISRNDRISDEISSDHMSFQDISVEMTAASISKSHSIMSLAGGMIPMPESEREFFKKNAEEIIPLAKL